MTATLLPQDTLLDILGTLQTVPTPFHGLAGEDIRWLDDVAQRSNECGVPQAQWADVSIFFSTGEIKEILEERQRHLARLGAPEWGWEEFRTEFVYLCGKGRAKFLSSDITLNTPTGWGPKQALENTSDDTSLETWLATIETGCQEHHIPNDKWSHAATCLLPDGLRGVIQERQHHLMFFGKAGWTWDEFKDEVCCIIGEARTFPRPYDLSAQLASWDPLPIYSGIPSDSSAQSWLSEVEQGCESREIPSHYRTDAAIYFLKKDLKAVMEARKAQLAGLGGAEWGWDSFKAEFLRFVGVFTKIFNSWENPTFFGGGLNEDATSWLNDIATRCERSQLPENQYAYAAIYHISGEMRTTLEERTIGLVRSGGEWTWESFRQDLGYTCEQHQKVLLRNILHTWENPPIFAATATNYAAWLEDVEKGCRERDVPENRFSDAAMYFLRGDFRAVMEEKRAAQVQTDMPWTKFAQEFRQTYDTLRKKRKEPARMFTSPELSPVLHESARQHLSEHIASAAAGLNALSSGGALPSAVMAVMNAGSWFRRAKSNR